MPRGSLSSLLLQPEHYETHEPQAVSIGSSFFEPPPPGRAPSIGSSFFESPPGSGGQPPPPPPPPMSAEVGKVIGPEALSSQAATETVAGGDGRPSGAVEDSGGERYFNVALGVLSTVLVAFGLNYQSCLDRMRKKKSVDDGPRGSLAESAGRPFAENESARRGSSSSILNSSRQG
eukprot:TRINITY_DN113362_c0_g1_i1.p1 TRINITY_DN113362_c0_g1~~TRINITY_DN113362_c0_g1_i1.p1  ORF type:complete len:176 (+),score=30.71 TRINITY_DN113362_c0_g1_i1:76-603(+)